MQLDAQMIFNVLAGITVALGGFLFREIWDAVSNLRADIQRVEVHLPNNYVSKQDFKASIDELKLLTMRVLDKLDDKLDKPVR